MPDTLPADHATGKVSPGRILVIDDEEDIRESLETLLIMEGGFEVQLAVNATDGLKKFLNFRTVRHPANDRGPSVAISLGHAAPERRLVLGRGVRSYGFRGETPKHLPNDQRHKPLSYKSRRVGSR